jgi:hypothetical protein
VHTIRYLYGVDTPCSDQWRFWLNIHVTGDKYLVPELGAEGSMLFCRYARKCTSADDIFDIIETCRTEFSHNDEFVELAAELREKNLGKLLSNNRFRAQLDSGGKEALWQQLDELSSKVFIADKKEKSYRLCPAHAERVFEEPIEDNGGTCTCCLIQQDGYGQQGDRRFIVVYNPVKCSARKAWIEG